MLLSPVVVALIWKWILARDGVLNAALQGVGASPVNWLLDAGWAFGWTVFISIWAHMGFYTLILLAGLQAIPADIYEAADMDAAPPWRVFTRLTLPLLMPSLLVVVVLGLIRAVQIFDEVYVLTGGGPGQRHDLSGAVHLQHRLRAAGPAIRPGLGRVAAAGRRADAADPAAAHGLMRRSRA